MSYTTAPDTIVRRHPIRGALWGVLLGTGITLHLVNLALVPFGTWTLLAAPIAAGLVLGILWGRFGPIKALKGRIPAALRRDAESGESSQEARRAAQLAAARRAQTELQNVARASGDDAMVAALAEAQNDVLDSVSRRVGRVVTRRVAPPSPPPIATPRRTMEIPPVGATPGTTPTAASLQARQVEPSQAQASALPRAPGAPSTPALTEEQLADHPAARFADFDRDLDAAAKALTAKLDAAWELQ